MKRRNFIKGLCKAVGVAAVVPTVLAADGCRQGLLYQIENTAPFETYGKITSKVLEDHVRDLLVIKCRRHGRTESTAKMFINEYCNPMRYGK